MKVRVRLQLLVALSALGSPLLASADDSPALDAPAEVGAGGAVPVKWSGPSARLDKITLVEQGAADAKHSLSSGYVRRGGAVLRAPEKPGAYELRYWSHDAKKALASRPLAVSAVTASVEGPGTAASGATIAVTWTGPKNRLDKIGIVAAGAPDQQKPLKSEYVRANPTKIRIPEPTGEYEIRYLTGESRSTLAKTALTITGTSAAIEGPASAEAGSTFKVKWTGPANDFDRIVAAAKGSGDGSWVATGYVKKGHPLALRAPVATGEYELRYLTGGSHGVLARAQLQVTPAKLEPGRIEVSASAQTLGSGGVGTGGALEILLDASGSMLQRIGGQRRIDIAVQTLKHLTANVVPAGTPFALRVFGRDAASCQTALEVPLQPLDAAAIDKHVSALEPKQSARTPIAASLQAVAADLRAATGERLAVLITDGEETCGGNPATAIEKLRRARANVRLSIVGFAIEDAKLASTFKLWSEAGGGAYFEARDAAGLNQALSLAVRPAFEISDARKQVVATGFVGDPAVELLPGAYTVKLKVGQGTSKSVTVRAKETSAVRF